MDQAHTRRPTPQGSAEKRKTVSRPMTQLPAGPDYWPVPAQPTVVGRRVEELAAARELTPEPTA